MRFTHFVSLFLALCFSVTTFFAQENQSIQNNICATDMYRELWPDHTHTERTKQMEKNYREAIRQLRTPNQAGARNLTSDIWTIPVVVHIVHTGHPLGSTANPTDAEIQALISEATSHFRHMQPGAQTYSNPLYGVDTEIELCLATRDPNGNETTGIIRHIDSDLAFLDALTESVDPYVPIRWDFYNYLNLVILEGMTPFGGLYVDGRFMTFYRSSELTAELIVHEIGHEFGLEHTFGLAGGDCTNDDCLTDGDRVCDTPPKGYDGGGGFSCTSNSCSTDEDDTSTNNPYRSVANGGVGDQNDMLENYMDYSDQCWDAFTVGQKDRMRFMISTGIRNTLLTSNGCAPACIADLLVDQPISSGVQILPAGNSVTGTSSINGSMTDITFSAGNFILLDQGFHVNGQAQFLAEIGGCASLRSAHNNYSVPLPPTTETLKISRSKR